MEKKRILSLSNMSWVLVAGLIFCNIFLVVQNLRLKDRVNGLIAEQKIQIGHKLDQFEAVDIKNTAVKINYDDSTPKRLILYSSTTCPYCKKQNPLWNEMIRQVDSQKYEVLELFRDLEDKEKVMNYLVNNGFIKNNSEPDLKVLFPNDAFLDKNKMNSTPLTLVVDKDGTVEKAWFGLWNKSTIADVNSSLGISIQPNI